MSKPDLAIFDLDNTILNGDSDYSMINYLVDISLLDKAAKSKNDEFIKDTVDRINEDNSDQDFFSAIKICKKKSNVKLLIVGENYESLNKYKYLIKKNNLENQVIFINFHH